MRPYATPILIVFDLTYPTIEWIPGFFPEGYKLLEPKTDPSSTELLYLKKCAA